MNDLLSLINSYRIIVGAIAVILVTSLLLKRYWDKVSFFWLRIRCSIPLIGKVARLSKETSAWDPRTGWFNSEKTLCGEFSEHLEDSERASPEFFVKCQSYLSKAQETGRKELHVLGWLLIAAMVFIEAMGFSYVLAGWTIPGASEALQQQGAIGIAFLISALLVYLTHKTGQEMHHNHLVKKVRTWFNGQNEQLVPDTAVTLDSNEKDDEAPAWRQLLNRLKTNASVKPGWTVTGVTVAFIIAVAIGATYVRGQALDEMLSRQQLTQSSTGAGTSYQDPYSDTALPDELANIQRDADHSSEQSVLDHQRKGGWGTFIVLAFIFIFLQIMGMMIGYFTGFAGKESAVARGYMGSFRNKNEYSAYHAKQRNKVMHIAQKHLSRLQQRMVSRAQQNNTDGESINRLRNPGERTFLAYADEVEQKHHDSEVRYNARHATQMTDQEQSHSLVSSVSNQIAQMTTPQPDLAAVAATPTAPLDKEILEDKAIEARREDIRKRLQEELRQKQARQRQEEDAEYEAQLRRDMGLDNDGALS